VLELLLVFELFLKLELFELRLFVLVFELFLKLELVLFKQLFQLVELWLLELEQLLGLRLL
jgi:hypothetical protein